MPACVYRQSLGGARSPLPKRTQSHGDAATQGRQARRCHRLRRETLKLDSIKDRSWTIQACSATQGDGLSEGMGWPVHQKSTLA